MTTKISKVGVVAGAGVHWNAQPMFHCPAAMVNEELVQLPESWVAGMSTVGGPGATVVAVDPPAAVVEVAVDPPAAVVEVAVDPPAAVVVVVAEPAAGGSL